MDAVTNAQPRENIRIRPLRALRALRRLLRDPNDTEQVFVMIGALGAINLRFKVRALRKTEAGRRLLDDKPSLAAALRSSRPEDFAPGTLGREYHAFLKRERITTDGLIELSGESTQSLQGDMAYLSSRLTQMHDLWHVVAGYEGDLVGEACLLAFSMPQTKNPAVALIVASLYLVVAGRIGVRPLIRAARRRGAEAGDLVSARWEELLHQPLDEVRAQLRVGPRPVYRQVRAEQLGPKGLFGDVPRAA